MKINLLYDKFYNEKEGNEGFFYEKSYTYSYKPINYSADECIFDYHLPLQYLIHKYYPQADIQEINLADVTSDTKSIYQVSFKFLAGFFRQYSFNEFYRGLPTDVINLFERGKCIIVLNDSHEFSIYNSIIKSLNTNSAVPKHLLPNIIITSSNINNQANKGKQPLSLAQTAHALSQFQFAEVFKHSPFSIYGYRYFEEAVAFQKQQFYSNYSYNNKLAALTSADTKLGICLNRVYRNHRLTTTYLLHQNNLQESFLISHNTVDDNQVKGLMQSDWKEIIDKDKLQEFVKTLPLVQDSTDFTINHWNNVPFDLVEKSFMWLITETICDNTMHSRNFFTEKIYKPISLFMPFIIIGQPRSLYNLKLDGYKSFDRWWDESYDMEANPVKRLRMIMEVLKCLAAKPKDEIIQMYMEMQDVLEHNNNILMNTRAGEEYIKSLVSLYNNL